MKTDELRLLLSFAAGDPAVGVRWRIHRKRRKWLYKKWFDKGWLHKGLLTAEGWRIVACVVATRMGNGCEQPERPWRGYWDHLDGKVVIVHWRQWHPPQCGILLDCGDNGQHFYTSGTCRRGSSVSYFLGEDSRSNDALAFIEPHPEPAAIWRHLNYAVWKNSHPVYRSQDYFHRKDWRNRRYDSEGRPRFPPCLPNCQCQDLEPKGWSDRWPKGLRELGPTGLAPLAFYCLKENADELKAAI